MIESNLIALILGIGTGLVTGKVVSQWLLIRYKSQIDRFLRELVNED